LVIDFDFVTLLSLSENMWTPCCSSLWWRPTCMYGDRSWSVSKNVQLLLSYSYKAWSDTANRRISR